MLRHVNKELKQQLKEKEDFLEYVKAYKELKGESYDEVDEVILMLEHLRLNMRHEQRFNISALRIW